MKSIGNWRTSLAGILGPPLIYLSMVGWKLPETKQEWAALIGSVMLSWLGLAAKDGATGSAPGATR